MKRTRIALGVAGVAGIAALIAWFDRKIAAPVSTHTPVNPRPGLPGLGLDPGAPGFRPMVARPLTVDTGNGATIYAVRPSFLERDGYQIVPWSRDYTPPGGSPGVQPDPARFLEWHTTIEDAVRDMPTGDALTVPLWDRIEAAREAATRSFMAAYVGGYLDRGALRLFVLGRPVPGLTLWRVVTCEGTIRERAGDQIREVEFARSMTWGAPRWWEETYSGLQCAGSEPVQTAYTLRELPRG